MGKKYLLEIEENKDGSFAWSNFAPYTEPDLEQVRKESYDKGYDDAAEEKYNDGLADAWEAARKICTNWVLSDSVLSEIFGMDKTIDDIMKENTASECIEKIRQHEQEKEEIKVGDEVLAPFGTAVVTNIVDDKIWFCYADGHCGFDYKKDKPRKTGRHFPEIATILEKMRGEQDG